MPKCPVCYEAYIGDGVLPCADCKPHAEQCQRCGEWGPDRRTLRMSCFYAMDELSVPFGRDAVLGRHCKQVDVKMGIGMQLPVWGEPEGETRHYDSYTLRVCKSCRADWMRAIEKWFTNPERPVDTGTGIYIRDRGATRPVTPGEIDYLKKCGNETSE